MVPDIQSYFISNLYIYIYIRYYVLQGTLLYVMKLYDQNLE